MKTLINLRAIILVLMALMLFSCACYYPNHGTASDRTGTNGATNGNGKVPR